MTRKNGNAALAGKLGWALALLWLPSLAGCSGTNVVAGDEKSKAQQLQELLPGWCASACAKLKDCANVPCACAEGACDCPSYQTTCPAECRDAITQFTQGDEFCADVGERLEKCIDTLTCAALNAGSCNPTDAENQRCSSSVPSDDGSSTPVPQMVGVGSGGSPDTGDFTQAPRQAIACLGASGGGYGPAPSDGSVAGITCEEQRSGCTDGHDYAWLCARDSLGQTACSCLLDSTVVGAFKPGVDCPSLSDVDVGCDWGLVDN